MDLYPVGANYFSDNSPQFVFAMRELAANVGLALEAPLLYCTKEQVYELGKKLGVDPSKTWSCDFPHKGEPCGKCDKCDDATKYL